MQSEKNEKWLDNRIQYIKGLKSQNEQQRLILSLNEKKDRSPLEEKKFSFLIRAEKASQKATDAKAKVMALVNSEKKTTARLERKARDHQLYQSAGLMILAGLVDRKTGKPTIDKAALVGALSGLNELTKDNPKWLEWKNRGEKILIEKIQQNDKK